MTIETKELKISGMTKKAVQSIMAYKVNNKFKDFKEYIKTH